MREHDIERIARARMELNADHPHTEDYGDSLEMHKAGVRGEAAVADRYNLGYEHIRAVRGSDGGSDFTVYFGGYPLNFDVKCRSGKWDDLLVKAKKFKYGKVADYFVLCQCIGKQVIIHGWEDARIVRCMPVVQLRVPTHIRYLDELRPLVELDHLMALRDGLASMRA